MKPWLPVAKQLRPKRRTSQVTWPILSSWPAGITSEPEEIAERPPHGKDAMPCSLRWIAFPNVELQLLGAAGGAQFRRTMSQRAPVADSSQPRFPPGTMKRVCASAGCFDGLNGPAGTAEATVRVTVWMTVCVTTFVRVLVMILGGTFLLTYTVRAGVVTTRVCVTGLTVVTVTGAGVVATAAARVVVVAKSAFAPAALEPEC